MSGTALRSETSATAPTSRRLDRTATSEGALAAAEPERRCFLRRWAEACWSRCWAPVVSACVRLAIDPCAITIASALLVCLSAGLLAAGYFSAGGWVLLFGASLDLVDGRVARESGNASRAGAFLDSTLDRLGELALFAGFAVQFSGSPVLYAALAAGAASMLVSYARARGEALGAGLVCRTGLMQRPERIALVALPCMFSTVVEAGFGPGAGRTLVGGALIALAALSSASAFARSYAIFRALGADRSR